MEAAMPHLVVVAQIGAGQSFAVLISGPNLLADLIFIFGDDRVGRFYDGLRAPVILLEFVDDTVGVSRWKLRMFWMLAPRKP